MAWPLYMDLTALRRLLQEGDTINGAYLTVDQNRWDDFMREVKETPRAAVILIKREQFGQLPQNHGPEHRHSALAVFYTGSDRGLRRGFTTAPASL